MSLPFDSNEYETLLSLIKPKPYQNRWMEIRWGIDIGAARKIALSQNRPLFILAMNGYPLGNT